MSLPRAPSLLSPLTPPTAHGLLNTLAPVTSVQPRSSLLPFILHPTVNHQVPALCSSTMESLSELQNPLLDKNSKHMVMADYGYGGDFHSNQYQENIINYFVTGGGGGGGSGGGGVAVTGGNGKAKAQLLDATSLHLAVEAFYKPNFILYKDDVSGKGKDYKTSAARPPSWRRKTRT